MERLYTTKLVAAAWSVNPETVRRLAARGLLRFVLVGSERRYPESALRDYLRSAGDRSLSIRRRGPRSYQVRVATFQAKTLPNTRGSAIATEPDKRSLAARAAATNDGCGLRGRLGRASICPTSNS
jgi:excisionase family DNA binding protein